MALTKVTGEGVGTLTSGISGTDITLSGGVNIFNSSTDSIDIRATGNRCEIDNPDNNAILLKTGGTTRIRVDPNGLLFGSDTAAANALDDYEEGTWTPALSSGNSSTYDAAFGNYTKIGRFVACHFTLEIGNTFAGGTEQYVIGGLPFARSNQSNTASGSGIVHYFENIATNAHALTLRVDSGQSVMYITGAIAADGATGLAVNANVLQAQANLFGSVFYYTN